MRALWRRNGTGATHGQGSDDWMLRTAIGTTAVDGRYSHAGGRMIDSCAEMDRLLGGEFIHNQFLSASILIGSIATHFWRSRPSPASIAPISHSSHSRGRGAQAGRPAFSTNASYLFPKY
jgi:hypothetical protein